MLLRYCYNIVVTYINVNRKLMRRRKLNLANRRLARQLWGASVDSSLVLRLQELSEEFGLCISKGDLKLIDQNWYVTHVGLLRLARRRRCSGIELEPVLQFCDPDRSRFSFKAMAYKSNPVRGFAGYGDADPSNISPLLHGAELRIAETRAVNRALRKLFGIGICSVEEIGSVERSIGAERPVRKYRLIRPMGTMAIVQTETAREFATGSAELFASTSSMLNW